MAFRLIRKMIFYGMIMGFPYLIGYCNGYEDCKYKKESKIEKIWVENKEISLNMLEQVTDSAYERMKNMIDDSRRGKDEEKSEE